MVARVAASKALALSAEELTALGTTVAEAMEGEVRELVKEVALTEVSMVVVAKVAAAKALEGEVREVEAEKAKVVKAERRWAAMNLTMARPW